MEEGAHAVPNAQQWGGQRRQVGEGGGVAELGDALMELAPHFTGTFVMPESMYGINVRNQCTESMYGIKVWNQQVTDQEYEGDRYVRDAK